MIHGTILQHNVHLFIYLSTNSAKMDPPIPGVRLSHVDRLTIWPFLPFLLHANLKNHWLCQFQWALAQIEHKTKLYGGNFFRNEKISLSKITPNFERHGKNEKRAPQKWPWILTGRIWVTRKNYPHKAWFCVQFELALIEIGTVVLKISVQ